MATSHSSSCIFPLKGPFKQKKEKGIVKCPFKQGAHEANLPITGGASLGAGDVAVTGQTAHGEVVEAIHALVTLVALHVVLALALTGQWVAGQTQGPHRAAAAGGAAVGVVFTQVVEPILTVIALFPCKE